MQCVFDTGFLFLHFDLRCSTDLDDGNAANQLCQALLEFLLVVVTADIFDLSADLFDAGLDLVFRTRPVDDRRRVLVQGDTLGLAEIRQGNILQLQPEFLADGLGASEDCDVSQDLFSSVAVARGLDRGNVQGTAQLVQDQRGQCLAFDVIRDDQERFCSLAIASSTGKRSCMLLSFFSLTST